MTQPTDERMDYVAIKEGHAYALMSADHTTAEDVREFYEDNPDADIRLMPTNEAVRLHLAFLDLCNSPR